jgi:serine protease AprX
MSNLEDQYIKIEIRFSGKGELNFIEGQLTNYAARNTEIYDGLLDVEVPVGSLKLLREQNLLIDFPVNPTDQNADSEVSKTMPITIPGQKTWLNKLKNIGKRVLIDYVDNKISSILSDVANDDSPPQEEDIDASLASIDSFQEEIASPAHELYILTLKGVLDDRIREWFTKKGILLSTYHAGTDSSDTFICELSVEQYTSLQKEAFVSSIRALLLEDKIDKTYQDNLLEENTDTQPVNKMFNIIISDPGRMDELRSIIESSDEISYLDNSQNVLRVEAGVDSAVLASLPQQLGYICSVSAYEPPSLFSDVCRETLGLNFTNASDSYFGEGEVVAIIDSGIDSSHPDFGDRIVKTLHYGRGTEDDLVGHGTHVAGIICGDGASSQGKIVGVAPRAKVVSVGVVYELDMRAALDIPSDLGKLLKLAVDNGATVINISWGTPISGEYQNGGFSIDAFLYDNPTVFVVAAAGNEGSVKNERLAYNTVGVPATAKNVLTVGAATTRRQVPKIEETYGMFKPEVFKTRPYSDESLVSQIDKPSNMSSRGPTDYDSIKPEVISPGNYILAAKSSKDGVTQGKNFYDDRYIFKSGTSMAAPMVTGIALLLREYLRKVHDNVSPSSSLLKAIIIAGSKQVANPRKDDHDDSINEVGFPDFDQGFGMVSLGSLLNEKTVKLNYYEAGNKTPDALMSRAKPGTENRGYCEYTFENTENTGNISIVLCWIDPPAKGIQNNLQLSVKIPAGNWELGNLEHIYKKSSVFDDVNMYSLKPHDKYNNVEKVLIKDPEIGNYRIRITAQSTLSPQGYSLVVMGNTSSFKKREYQD